MKELWTQEEASLAGEFVSFERAWQWPKPMQQPHPPVHLGSRSGPRSFAHVVEWCDGWMPIPFLSPDFAATLTTLRNVAEERGRDPATIEVVTIPSAKCGSPSAVGKGRQPAEVRDTSRTSSEG